MDQSKKTMRHFYCRDVLWETFEQMANDFDCSIDYLINEAMRYYARSKNYQSPATSGAEGSPGPSNQPTPGPRPLAQTNAPPVGGAPSTSPPRRPAPTTQPPPSGANTMPPRRPAPPTPALQPAGM